MANQSNPTPVNPVLPTWNPGGPAPAPAPNPHVAQGVTTNSTNDPRIIWEDGHIAIIYAKDFPAGTGMGRSKTRDDLKSAINADVDDQLQTAVGPGSANKLVKVWLRDMLARPPITTQKAVQSRLPISPDQFRPVAPVIAQGGSYKGHVIPDFPHDCVRCGGKYYQGMFSSVHPTPDGECPATKTPTSKKRR